MQHSYLEALLWKNMCHFVERCRNSNNVFCVFWCSQIIYIRPQRRSQGGGWRGSSPPFSDQNIDVYFLSFSPTLHCKSRSGALQNVLWQYHRRSNTFVIKPRGYEFSRFEKYWSSFLHSCVFCATVHNKSWVLSCSASVETSMTFELPTVSIDV